MPQVMQPVAQTNLLGCLDVDSAHHGDTVIKHPVAGYELLALIGKPVAALLLDPPPLLRGKGLEQVERHVLLSQHHLALIAE